MSESISNAEEKEKEDKRVRRVFQRLLQRRPFFIFWNILDFPYLAEVVRHDSRYLRRILVYSFVDHPALSQYLILISWREVSKKLKLEQCCPRHRPFKREMLPIGLERTLWSMYKRQVEISKIWSPAPSLELWKDADDELPILDFNQFIGKINGVMLTQSQGNCRSKEMESGKSS